MSQPAAVLRSPTQQKAHPRSPACPVFTAKGHACGYSPSSVTHDFFWTYSAQVARLSEIFPRGRFKRDEDGTAIVVPRAKKWAGCHLYEHAPRRVVGLFYVGGYRRITKGWLAAYVIKRTGGDGEGIIHLRWDPGLARALGTFSRPGQRGRGTPFEKRESPAMDDARRDSAASPGGSGPPMG